MLNGSLYFRKPPYHHTIETSNDLVSKIGSSPLGPSIAIHSYSILGFQVSNPICFWEKDCKETKHVDFGVLDFIPNFGLWKMPKCQNAESPLAQLRCDPVQLQDQVSDKVPEGSGADTL